MRLHVLHILLSLLTIGSSDLASAQAGLSLQQALQTARNNNAYLKAEQFNIRVAEADVVTAGLRPNPTLNNQSLQLARPAGPSGAAWYSAQNRQVWWQLTKPFQVAGQRQYKLDVAHKNVTFAEKNYAETERNLFAEVAGKWLQVWTAQKQLEVIAIARANVDTLVSINRLRYKNLVITQTDLSRTELLSRQYAVQYQSASLEVLNRKKELRFLLGVGDSISIDTSDVLFTISSDVDSLISQSLLNRSDVASTQALVDASGSNIQLQRSLAYPQPELGFIWNPQNTMPYIGVYATIDLPVFSRNQGEIKKSYILKDQAEQQLVTIQGKIQTEISTAWASYQLQKQNTENFKAVLRQSQSILDNVRYSYLKGGTTIIDFLEAQRSWLETQQQYYDALELYRQSYIQLLFATGIINQLAQ